MNGDDSLQTEVAQARTALETAETDTRQATALLSELNAEIDDSSRGVGNEEEFHALTDEFQSLVETWEYTADWSIPDPFDDLEVESFEELFEELSESFEVWAEQPRGEVETAVARVTRLVRILRTAARELDAEEILEVLDGLTTAVGDRDTDRFDEHLERLERRLADQDLEDFEQIQRRIEVRYKNVRSALDPDRLRSALEGLEESYGGGDDEQVDRSLKRLGGAIDALESIADHHRDRLNALNARRAGQYPDDPASELPGLTDHQPVLLMPVRLETRFRTADEDEDTDGKLLVRTYPDDIHIDTHDRELTADEREWGLHFWRQVWWWANEDRATSELRPTHVPESIDQYVDLESLPDEADVRFEAIKERVWGQLVERFGDERAAWIKRVVAPEQKDAILAREDTGHVPEPDFERLARDAKRRPDAWTRPPRARLLPDRWVAFAYSDGEVLTARSRPIREPLGVGPDPDTIGATAHTDGERSERSADGVEALTGGEMDWMFDFETAKAVGMGLEIPLTAEHLDAGIDRLVVVGVKTSLDDDSSATRLRDLLDAHHYTDGLEVLSQGTPTNNTVEEASTFNSTVDPASSLGVECERPLVSTGDGSDGEIAARMLGIDPAQLGTGQPGEDHVFARVAGSGQTEQTNARHVNAGLWSATWGYFVPHMLLSRDHLSRWSDDAAETFLRHLEAYRRHFVRYVRARGPVPALRVGEQPYGVLPVTNLSEYEAIPELTESETTGRLGQRDGLVVPSIDETLVTQIQRLREAFEPGVRSVPTVDGGTDPIETFVDISSMAATASRHRVRELFGEYGILSLLTGDEYFTLEGIDPDLLENLDESTVALLRAYQEESRESELRDWLEGVASDLPTGHPGGTGSLPTPRIAKLVFRNRAAGPIESLVGDGSYDVMQSVLEDPVGVLRTWDSTDDGDTNPGMDALLDLLVYYALLQEYLMARARLGNFHYTDEDQSRLEPRGRDVWDVIPEAEWIVPDSGTRAWDKLDQPIPYELADHLDIPESTSFANTVRDYPEIDDAFADTREAITALQEVDTASLEQLLTETLDLASHRLDAWATSVATRRVSSIREHQTASEAGIHVGAYGVVENLEPSGDPASAGYLHAPSLPQATTAAVLRSGYQTHRGTERGELLSVDLSADRVRTALELVDGVRQGQPLGALLGYQFERRLHEHEHDLDQYIPTFRVVAPLVAGKGPLDDDTEQTASEDVVATRDVVDGVALNRSWREDAIPWGTNPGSETVALPVEGTPDFDAISEAFEGLEERIDAVRDVMTAEGLHQLVNGNPSRAGGSLDALSRGEAPPDLDVVETPRTGIGVTHRMLILFDGATNHDPVWESTPEAEIRATVEPNLNAFVGDLFGSPTRVCCLVEYEVTTSNGAAPDDSGTESEPARASTVVRLSELGLSPLDLLYLTEEPADARRSELEQRVVYHVLREGPDDVAPDGEISITFGPLDEWSAGPEPLGVDPVEDVSVGEVLEVASVARDLVTSGRAADAQDLALPEREADTTFTAVLGSRADTAQQQLADVQQRLKSIAPLFEAPPGNGSPIELLTELHEGVNAASGRLSRETLETIERELGSLSGEQLTYDISRLHEVVEHGLTLSRGADELLVRPAENQRIGGWAAAEPGSRISISVGGRRREVQHEEEATVGETGRFEASFDFTGVTTETEFTVTATLVDGVGTETAAASSRITAPGRVVRRYRPEHRQDDWIPGLRTVSALSSDFDSLATESVDLRSGLASVSAFDATSDEETFAAVVREAVTEVLAPEPRVQTSWERILDASITLPGFGSAPDDLDLWEQLSSLSEDYASDTPQVPPGADATSHPLFGRVSTPRGRAELQESLDELIDRLTTELSGFDAVLDTTVDVGRLESEGIEALRTALVRASYFGIHGSIPQSATGTSSDAATTLASQATSIVEEIADRLDQATSIGPPPQGDPGADHHRDRLGALLGESFVVLPPFEPPNKPELRETFTAANNETLQDGDVTNVETWFQRVARVRDQPRTLQRAFTYGESLGDLNRSHDPRLQTGQLPHRAADTWVGLPEAWPVADEDRRGGRLSLVAHLYDEVETGSAMAGFFVDEWVETVPAKSETTGLSFHFDRPSSRAPQSLLLAVPPSDEGWSLEALADSVEESLDLAKLRTVDPDALSEADVQDDHGLGHFLPALCFAENSGGIVGGPDTISIDFTETLPDPLQGFLVSGWTGETR
ncbi:hypothetical protein [Halobellus litoreus]|uniref:VWFA domain-containing protein n=1 Tax=Halobellus litoreus TaxID=755310 RepID=A0ABD6DXK9_9EURY|nr:hypothetical protein [Halobellus litoreus]